MTYKVFVDGQEGTTGLQINEYLAKRADIELLKIDSDKRKDLAERKRLINESDITFLCLPDEAAKESVTLVDNPNTCVIDASTAHRVNPAWTFGLPELAKDQREKIRRSKRIANPGCHASAFILALKPLVGRHASSLFAFGLFNASLFGACILPLSTAFYICEGMGWEVGVNRRFREAPQFYSLYTGIIALGAAVILLPRVPLIKIMLVSQVTNGLLLPFVLIFMLLLVNNKRLMGEHTNSRIYNVFAVTTVVVMILLSIILLFGSFQS